MHPGKLLAAVAAVCAAIGATGVAVAATGTPAGATVIKAVFGPSAVKINRYVEDSARWNKDVYTVKSGGTLHIVNDAAGDGPHTFTVVTANELPRTVAQISNCAICNTLAKAHGANPGSNTPPKFQYLKRGVGQNTPPDVTGPGDSGITGPGKQGESINFKVTAKPGTVLEFMCLIHPWMQAKLLVVK
jgi:hypothetical protein